MRGVLPPELLNRFDEIAISNPLSQAHLKQANARERKRARAHGRVHACTHTRARHSPHG